MAGLPRPLDPRAHPARRPHRGGLGHLNPHLASGLKRYEAEHDWLTTIRLPAYPPDLNPVEAVWSLVRRAMANTAFGTPDDLDRTLRREVRRTQLRPPPHRGLPHRHRPGHQPAGPTLQSSVAGRLLD
ncbi:transposase [Streptomyces sp. NPDC006288]|uniref:transposase n=1 Tax=Streptomyces sp. NPDC006288 TaxID=3156743 RepID=UPI0033B2A128